MSMTTSYWCIQNNLHFDDDDDDNDDDHNDDDEGEECFSIVDF